MSKSYTDITKQVAGNMAKLRKEVPQVSQAFSDLATNASVRKERNTARHLKLKW